MTYPERLYGAPFDAWNAVMHVDSLSANSTSESISPEDCMRLRDMRIRKVHDISFRRSLSLQSRLLLAGRFEFPDLTADGAGDPTRCAAAFVSFLIGLVVEQTHVSSDSRVLQGPAAPVVRCEVDNPHMLNVSVIPGDAKRASEEVDRGDCEPLSFYIDRFGRPRDHSRHLLNLAAGTDAGIQIRHVGDGARSQLHRAQLSFNEQDATLTVSGLPVDVDAQTLRLRIGSVLLRPAENSSKSMAVFSVRDAWTHGDEGSTHEVAELLEPGIARAIEERLKSQG